MTRPNRRTHATSDQQWHGVYHNPRYLTVNNAPAKHPGVARKNTGQRWHTQRNTVVTDAPPQQNNAATVHDHPAPRAKAWPHSCPPHVTGVTYRRVLSARCTTTTAIAGCHYHSRQLGGITCAPTTPSHWAKAPNAAQKRVVLNR